MRSVTPYRYRAPGATASVDICQVIEETDTGHDLSWIRRDVLDAVGISTVNLADEPGHDGPLVHHGSSTRITLEETRALLVDVPGQHQAAALLAFLEAREHRTIAIGPARALAQSAPAAAILPDRYWTLRGAALLLDLDPAISTGRQRLVDHCLSRDLLVRDLRLVRDGVGALRPSKTALAERLAFERRVKPQGLTEAVPQVLLTAAGVFLLHEQLGGSAPINLTPDLATAHLE